jgi:hypothetical protein
VVRLVWFTLVEYGYNVLVVFRYHCVLLAIYIGYYGGFLFESLCELHPKKQEE